MEEMKDYVKCETHLLYWNKLRYEQCPACSVINIVEEAQKNIENFRQRIAD